MYVLQAVMSEIKSGFFKMDKLDLLLPKFSVAGSLELTGPLGDLNMSRVSPPLKGALLGWSVVT
jgi:hypothetical protein